MAMDMLGELGHRKTRHLFYFIRFNCYNVWFDPDNYKRNVFKIRKRNIGCLNNYRFVIT